MNEVRITDSAARVLEVLMDLVQGGVVSMSRKSIAQKLDLSSPQVSRCFKELEDKGVIFYSAGGHMCLDKSLCGHD